MDTRVAIQWVCQIAAVWRVGGVVGGEFRLGRERAIDAKRIDRLDIGVHACLSKLGFVKGISRPNRREQFSQLGGKIYLEKLPKVPTYFQFCNC